MRANVASMIREKGFEILEEEPVIPSRPVAIRPDLAPGNKALERIRMAAHVLGCFNDREPLPLRDSRAR